MKDVIIKEFEYNQAGLDELKEKTADREKNLEESILFEYPTVYIINDDKKDKYRQKYNVYVGETNNIYQRTSQHLKDDIKSRKDWELLSKAQQAKMYVIGHEHFNKSMTLDLEDKLMLYMSSVESVKALYNRRTNQQKYYYPHEEAQDIFNSMWKKLNKKNSILFPDMALLQNLAIFKASPFHKLTEEQLFAKEQILTTVKEALKKEETGQLVMVSGEAGAGKTVLMSNIFNELVNGKENLKIHLLVNHDEQVKVYEQISKKLGWGEKAVLKPTTFINNHQEQNAKVDVVFVDEAHLLWTQDKQSYRGKNQLDDLLGLAKVVIIIFDKNQVLNTTQIVEEKKLELLEQKAKESGNFIHLKNQMRMDAEKETIEWIRNLIDEQKVTTLRKKDEKYDLQVFDSPYELEENIKKKNKLDVDSDYENGISRMIATYDWEYKAKGTDEDGKPWRVKIGDWEKPWNNQIKRKKRKNKSIAYDMSWAEQPDTIEEVGSTYTVQGSDLNYAGVIIGPSVKYRDGKIVFDKEKHANKAALYNRTLSNGKKQSFAEELMRNELNVLLTRGVHGLYIYAVDDELRKVLKKALQY